MNRVGRDLADVFTVIHDLDSGLAHADRGSSHARQGGDLPGAPAMSEIQMRAYFIGILTVLFLLCGEDFGHAAGPWRASPSNTQGWQLMTPEERIEHQARVRGFTDYDACEAYRLRHHALMAERARSRDLALPEDGRDFCAHLKAARGQSGRNGETP